MFSTKFQKSNINKILGIKNKKKISKKSLNKRKMKNMKKKLLKKYKKIIKSRNNKQLYIKEYILSNNEVSDDKISNIKSDKVSNVKSDKVSNEQVSDKQVSDNEVSNVKSDDEVSNNEVSDDEVSDEVSNVKSDEVSDNKINMFDNVLDRIRFVIKDVQKSIFYMYNHLVSKPFNQKILNNSHCQYCIKLNCDGYSNKILNLLTKFLETDSKVKNIELENGKLIIRQCLLDRFNESMELIKLDYILMKNINLFIYFIEIVIYKIRLLDLDIKRNPYSKMIKKNKSIVKTYKHDKYFEIVNLMATCLFLFNYLKFHYYNFNKLIYEMSKVDLNYGKYKQIFFNKTKELKLKIINVMNTYNHKMYFCIDIINNFINDIINEEKKFSESFYPFTKKILIGISIIYEIIKTNYICPCDYGLKCNKQCEYNNFKNNY